MSPNNVVSVAPEFTVNKLKTYFYDQLDGESYSDENFENAFDEFIYRLSCDARATTKILESCGVQFNWDVYAGQAFLVDLPKDENPYHYITEDGTRYDDVNAIIANIIYTLNVDLLMESYWNNKTRNMHFLFQKVAA